MTVSPALFTLLMAGWGLFLLSLWVLYRFYRKLVIYDTVYQYLAGDIETNIKQFARMAHSSVMMGDHEVQVAHRNMVIMGKRLEEILHQMEDASGLRLRPKPLGPRPKVD